MDSFFILPSPHQTSVLDRVELYRGDAAKLPFDNETFDAVFISFTLELFDNPEISEWIHSKWPQYVDCRPIYVDESVQKAGYKMIMRETARLLLLPIEIVIALKDS